MIWMTYILSGRTNRKNVKVSYVTAMPHCMTLVSATIFTVVTQ